MLILKIFLDSVDISVFVTQLAQSEESDTELSDCSFPKFGLAVRERSTPGAS